MTQTRSAPQVAVGGGATPPPNVLLDQYKAYMGDLSSIGTRYTTAQTYYWTIVSALIAVLAIKDYPKPVAEYLKPSFVAIMCFIAAVSYVWRATSLHYRKLFGAKIAVLKQLEDRGLYTLFQTEGEILAGDGHKVPSLLAIEGHIPLGVMLAALALALYAIYYIATH